MHNNHKMGSSDSLLKTIREIMEKKHTTPETPKEKSLAKLAHPKDKITHKDVLVGRGVLKKENSGDRMGVIVGTRKEKVELEPKLKESNVYESTSSMERIHADLIKHVPVGHHYWMDIHHSKGPLSDKDHEDHKQTARSDEVRIKVSHHRDEDGYHHVLIHSPHKEDVKAAADHLYDDKSVMKKRKDDDAHYAKAIKEQVIERKLTGAETAKKEKLVLSLKKKMGGFKKRYGERAKDVMYATATKMAKEDVQPVNELEKSKYVDKVRDATDPSYGRGADHIIKKAGKEHGAKFAKDLEGIAYKSHFGRHKTQKSDPLKPLPGTSSPRVTKAGKMHSVDAKTMRDKIRARLGKHRKPNLPESSED